MILRCLRKIFLTNMDRVKIDQAMKRVCLEPRATLSWSAYHQFSPDFYERWSSGVLTDEEYTSLTKAAITHVKCMLVIHMDDRKMLRFDHRRLKKLEGLSLEQMKQLK